MVKFCGVNREDADAVNPYVVPFTSPDTQVG